MASYYAGVDVGSAWAKAVIVDEHASPVAYACTPTGLSIAEAGARCLAEACAEKGLRESDLVSLISTGYGRDDVPGREKTKSEVLCLAKGAFARLRRAMTVVDIGGQDSKVVLLDGEGHRMNYRMNRRCAAGTGSFLEIVCLRLGIQPEQLGPLAAKTKEVATLGSFCSVFSATEVLDLLRRGHSLESIARGVYRSVAMRILEMGVAGPILALSGGVVEHHPLIVEILQDVTAVETQALPRPQHTGAYGAALLALEESTARATDA